MLQKANGDLPLLSVLAGNEVFMEDVHAGLWDLTPALQAIVGNLKEISHTSIEELETPVADAVPFFKIVFIFSSSDADGERPDDEQVMATAAAIAYLQCRVASRNEEWQLLALKARHQLAQLLASSRSSSAHELVDQLITNAQSCIEETGSIEQRQSPVLSEAKAMIETMHRSIGALRKLLLQLPSATISASSSVPAMLHPSLPPSLPSGPRIEEVD